MGVVSAAMKFGGISFEFGDWWANPWSEVLSLVVYVVLIYYIIKSCLMVKK